MKGIFFILLLVVSNSLLSQESCVVKIVSSNGNVIIGANLSNQDGELIGTSNSRGTIFLGDCSNRTLIISHISHKDYWLKTNLDLSVYTVILELSIQSLPEAFIDSEKLPEIVFKSDTFHVSDFIFHDKGILLLTHGKKRLFKKQSEGDVQIFRDCKIVKLDKNLNLVASSEIIEECVGFYKDEYNQCFLRTLDSMFILKHSLNEISMSKVQIDIDFEKPAFLIIDEKEETILVNNYDSTFPAFEYFIQTGDSLTEICSLSDEKLLHTFRAQYRNLIPREKLNAYRMELRTGIDKEIISGYMTGFHQSILFDPIYAPSFVIEDSIYVVDILGRQISVFDKRGALQRVVENAVISEKGKNKFQNKIIQDPSTGKVYALYLVGQRGFLKRIDLVTGELDDPIFLTYEYPSKVQIMDGEMYYLYRPFSSPQKTYLYKEALN